MEEKINALIIAALHTEEPLTIKAISVRTKLSWITTKRRLNQLVANKVVLKREIEGGTKLFFLDPEFEKGEQEP